MQKAKNRGAPAGNTNNVRHWRYSKKTLQIEEQIKTQIQELTVFLEKFNQHI